MSMKMFKTVSDAGASPAESTRWHDNHLGGGGSIALRIGTEQFVPSGGLATVSTGSIKGIGDIRQATTVIAQTRKDNAKPLAFAAAA